MADMEGCHNRHALADVRAGSFTVTVRRDLLERNTHSFQHLSEFDPPLVICMKTDTIGVLPRIMRTRLFFGVRLQQLLQRLDETVSWHNFAVCSETRQWKLCNTHAQRREYTYLR